MRQFAGVWHRVERKDLIAATTGGRIINQHSWWNRPESFYLRTRDWAFADKCPAEETKKFYKVHQPAHVMRRHLPGTLDKRIHWKFRQELVHYSPETFVAVLPGGRLWGKNGVVISPDNRLLADVSIEFNKEAKDHAIFNEKYLSFPDFTGDTVGVLASVASGNYFHWMFDILPRLRILRESGLEIDRFALCLDGRPFQLETLQKLGISERLYLLHDQTHFVCAKLVVPSLPGDTGHMPKWVCDFLRTEFLTAGAAPERGDGRIYVSRQYACSRRVTNEQEVAALLAARGFRTVVPEALPVAQQARIFAGAHVIVAPHGAGLANLVFCQPGTRVIEIFSPNYVNVLYWGLSNHLGLAYYYLLGGGEAPEEYVDPHLVGDDITVDIGALQALLKAVLA